MNSVFSFGRFGKYFVYDLRRWMRSCGPALLLMSFMPLILYLIKTVYSAVFAGEVYAPGLTDRAIVLSIVSVIVAITYSSNVYGFVTEKRAGSAFLMLPVSRMEKFASMMVNAVIMVPAAFLLIYMATDAVICLMDPRCGSSLVTSAGVYVSDIETEFGRDNVPMHISIFSIVMSFVSSILYFLLGALLFKKHKVLFPILIDIGLQVLLYTFAGVLAINLSDLDWHAIEMTMKEPSVANALMLLWNTLSVIWDILLPAALSAAIWFRIKTLKH